MVSLVCASDPVVKARGTNGAGRVAAPLQRLPKNNSFNEKDNSAIKQAIQASLAGEDDEDCDSPLLRRGRGMTEGTDEYQINLLNANTHGMIR